MPMDDLSNGAMSQWLPLLFGQQGGSTSGGIAGAGTGQGAPQGPAATASGPTLEQLFGMPMNQTGGLPQMAQMSPQPQTPSMLHQLLGGILGGLGKGLQQRGQVGMGQSGMGGMDPQLLRLLMMLRGGGGGGM